MKANKPKKKLRVDFGKPKSIIAGIVAIATGFFSLASAVMVYMAAPYFVIAFVLKLLGVVSIPWFAPLEVSVIITPIYMALGGMFFAVLGMVITGKAIEGIQ